MHALKMDEADTNVKESCIMWVTMHSNPTSDLMEESIQLMIVKQCKGKRDPKDPKAKTGDCLVKIRPRLVVHMIWAPVLKFWHSMVNSCSGKILRSGPPPRGRSFGSCRSEHHTTITEDSKDTIGRRTQ